MSSLPTPPLYDPEAVRPMWEELELVGLNNLTTADSVDEMIGRPGTALMVVNSVCGCAAGNARPGVALALQHPTIPDSLGTVFAGVYRDAVEQARGHMEGVTPSSPSIGLFKDGELVFMAERRHIEGVTAEQVAEYLTTAFDKFCSSTGPSVPTETFDKYVQHVQCGSTIPLFGS